MNRTSGSFARVLIVIPAWNEEATVADIVKRTIAAGLDCLVVDDGSSDKTAAAALTAGAHVIKLPFNLGIGGALRCGFRWAVENDYEAVVQCDADGQHSPELISLLIEEYKRTGAHLVIGSRFLSSSEYQVGFLRRILMRRMAAMASKASGQQLTDTTSGFRCISGQLLVEFSINYPAEYMESFEALMVAARSGYVVREVAVQMSHRVAGLPSNRAFRAAGFTIRVLLGGFFGTRFAIHHYEHGC